MSGSRARAMETGKRERKWKDGGREEESEHPDSGLCHLGHVVATDCSHSAVLAVIGYPGTTCHGCLRSPQYRKKKSEVMTLFGLTALLLDSRTSKI